jgi:predicted transcriptional regulator
MSMKTVTFEASEESIAKIDEIAANLEADRETVLREALTMYLADYEHLKSELAEGIRQADAGETISHEEMLERFEAMKASARDKQAA